MKFSTADNSGGILIRAYAPGQIVIGETRFRNSLIVTPDRVVDDWRPQQAGQLSVEDFTPVLDLAPEIIVLGTGATQQFPAPSLYAAISGRGIGLEIMDTGAACRTYNILMAEGRQVAAALLMI